MSPARRRNGAGVPCAAASIAARRKMTSRSKSVRRGGRVRETRVQALVELAARDDIGQQQRRRLRRQASILERLPQRFGRAAGGHEDGAGARVRVRRAQRDVRVHGLQVRHPQEAGDAWGDHRFEGGAVSRSSSSPARSSSISAPAAADDASHASVMFPEG